VAGNKHQTDPLILQMARLQIATSAAVHAILESIPDSYFPGARSPKLLLGALNDQRITLSKLTEEAP
jgi:hypothetical protein